MRHSEHFKLFLKTLLGVLLVVFVIRGKMVDFNSLHQILFRPTNFLIAMTLLAFSALLCTARWLLLARAQDLNQNFWDLFSLTMIGSFFNTFMPGSVGGDLIKAWYIAGREPLKRMRAVFSVLLDRVLGLAVIIFYSAFTLLFYTQWLKGHLQLQIVAASIWAFTLFSLIGMFLFFTPGFWNWAVTRKLLEWACKIPKVEKMVQSAMLYRNQKGPVLLAFLLSGLSILGFNFLYSLQGDLLGVPLTLPQYFFVVPLALTFSAIPILPGGIGTGQVAFYTLFKWIGIPNPELGGTLCTLIQIYVIVFNCFGYLFYLRYKNRGGSLQSAPELGMSAFAKPS